MADQQSDCFSPAELNVDAKEYSRQLLSWMMLATAGTQEMLAASRKTIQASKEILAETDRVLGKR